MKYGVKEFNTVVFESLKKTDLPFALLTEFPLINNEDNLIKEDIIRILKESGIGIPAYYNEIEYTVNGKVGKYNRSRSGCFFCFFQKKIEWVWLYEQNPAKFFQAMAYEKDGYTWMKDEKLEELIAPNRLNEIKEKFLIQQKDSKENRTTLKLDFDDQEGCAACFI